MYLCVFYLFVVYVLCCIFLLLLLCAIVIYGIFKNKDLSERKPMKESRMDNPEKLAT